jgi:DNA-binding winged helix-turn-helix (wHTH) protein
MSKQGIHGEPRPGNLLPFKHAHESNGTACGPNDPLARHWGVCLHRARARPDEMSEIGADQAASATDAYLSGRSRAAFDAALEFGRFRVLLRQRQLVADGVPIGLGTRALDLLLVLLEADGSLVTKEQLLSRVWPGIVVSDENLKVQICALRRAFGKDRDLIRTESGRGYRFTAAVRSIVARDACGPAPRGRRRSSHKLIRQCVSW